MIARFALYAAVAGRSFQRYATYRAATLAGVFTNTVFGIIICYTYIALWQQRPSLGGYDVSDALTYAWLGQSLVVTVAIFGMGFQDEFADRVRSGDIAVDLYRPVSLQLWWLASDLGRASFQVAARGIPPTLIGAVLFDLRFPSDPLVWIWFVVSVGLAIVVSFGYRYIVGLSAFWLVDSRGLEYLVGVAAIFLSGMVLPLVVFPDWLGTIARVLPFSATIQVPNDIFLGKDTGWDLVAALGFQIAWAIVLLACGHLITSLATRKLVVAGG